VDTLDGTRLEHHVITVNGVRLHVVQAGPQEGPLIILLHGFPEFWYGWRKQIPHLARAGFRVWVPDGRGYNLSDKPAGIKAYAIDELVGDVLGLLDAAGQPKAYVVGHDWGAWWHGAWPSGTRSASPA
jgi:pimeloyl-ACP methyl ester carboxylesterase